MKPIFKIEADDQDITDLLSARLISLNISYETGLVSDKAEILLDNRDNILDIPPRGTTLIRALKTKHLMAGFAFDLTTMDGDDESPWDFSIKAERDKAWKRFTEQKPYVLIGSPACTPFSTWQRLNEAKSKDVEAMRRAKVEAVVHMNFVCRMYHEQAEGQILSARTPPSRNLVGTRVHRERDAASQRAKGSRRPVPIRS